MQIKMTKITIFSGFLGAGKTTLIQKLIQEGYVGEKLVLIENEFGEIGIDGGFLQDAGVEITEMNSGCICCSLVGDFGKALEKVLEQYHPDRILIEPSGVGKLSDVIRAVQNIHAHDVELDGFTTVVDAKKCKMYQKNFGEFFNNQITYASCLILSHTAGLSQEKLDDCVRRLRTCNEKAPIVTTDWAELTGKQLVEAMTQKNTLDDELQELLAEAAAHDHHHHDHDADEVFTSWGLETNRTITKEKLESLLQELAHSEKYGQVLRAKGMLPDADGTWYYFDLVPEETEIRTGAPIYTGKVCVIGSNLKEDELKAAFEA